MGMELLVAGLVMIMTVFSAVESSAAVSVLQKDVQTAVESTVLTENGAEADAIEVIAPITVVESILPGLNEDNFPRMDGSTANIPLMVQIYSEVCGVSLDVAEVKVEVSGGTGAVWRSMIYGYADILLVYEAPENIKAEMEEKEDMADLDIVSIGRDGLVFLVNHKNPVDSLTREQLVAIYTGEITNWAEVGGNDEPIVAFQRNEESGSQTLFQALLMQDVEPMGPPRDLLIGGMGMLIDSVAQFDGSGNAIGFSVYYYAGLMYDNPDLKLIAVDGVEPSAENIANGSYPLVNDFYVVIRSDEAEDSPARILRDWILSDAGRQILIETGYVPAS